MEQPAFYYDLASAESYLSAERIHHALGVVPEWKPVLASALPAGGLGAFRCAEEERIARGELERRAAEHGLPALRWPDRHPTDSEWAMLTATYAAGIGRAVAFSLAAFRQAFAAGRDLGDRDNVLIAAAACELHPAAVIRGAELMLTRRRLEESTQAAVAAGVRQVPAVAVGGEVFHGDAGLEEAAEALASAGAPPR